MLSPGTTCWESMVSSIPTDSLNLSAGSGSSPWPSPLTRPTKLSATSEKGVTRRVMFRPTPAGIGNMMIELLCAGSGAS